MAREELEALVIGWAALAPEFHQRAFVAARRLSQSPRGRRGRHGPGRNCRGKDEISAVHRKYEQEFAFVMMLGRLSLLQIRINNEAA
jgi:hypothetical protein